MSAQCAVGVAEMKRSPVVRGARGGNSARGARANPYRNERRVRSKHEKRRLRLRKGGNAAARQVGSRQLIDHS